VKVYLLETKTTSEDLGPGSTFWKRTILDPQLSLYLPALRKMGHDPHGCVYDVLRKPGQLPSTVALLDEQGLKIVLDASGQRVTTKAGKWRQTGDADAGYVLQSRPETPEEYGLRCLEAIAENPDRYYARGVVVRLESDEREAAFDTWNTATQMREARRLNIYPRNPDSCVNWGRECDYLNVCAGMADINDPLFFRFEEDVHEELAEEGVATKLTDDASLLTQSAMRAYRSCPRKFQLRYVARIRPIKKPETLTTGHSVHAALDAFRRTGGDIDAAKKALETEDLFVRAKEEAMLMGYAARWGKPTGVVAIEQTFRIPLINPDTGAASRTFSLGGRVDAIVSADSAQELMSAMPVVPADNLEATLEASIKQLEGVP
jgi:hypothetical protein